MGGSEERCAACARCVAVELLGVSTLLAMVGMWCGALGCNWVYAYIYSGYIITAATFRLLKKQHDLILQFELQHALLHVLPQHSLGDGVGLGWHSSWAIHRFVRYSTSAVMRTPHHDGVRMRAP